MSKTRKQDEAKADAYGEGIIQGDAKSRAVDALLAHFARYPRAIDDLQDVMDYLDPKPVDVAPPAPVSKSAAVEGEDAGSAGDINTYGILL